MHLRIDKSKEYAIALEGGGAKGAYEVGVWKALEEAGIKYCAVAGSSVGALNGALMAMRDLQTAIALWENITYSQIMDVDDAQMKAFFGKEMQWSDVPAFLKEMAEVVQNGGFDIRPLRCLLKDTIDEERVRQSDVECYLVTYSLTDRKEMDLDVKTLKRGTLHDMLLASAYFPAFKQQPLGGKFYTDGGIQNVLPIDSLLARGYRDILAIRIYGVGYEKKVDIPQDACITVIAPTEKLGSVLRFEKAQTQRDLQLGYFDGLRALYGLEGETYYIDRQWSEEKAYGVLCAMQRQEAEQKGKTVSLRELNEEWVPRLAKKKKVKGDYYALLLKVLEDQAEEMGITPFAIRTEKALFQEMIQKQAERTGSGG